MNINIKLINQNAVVPEYQTKGAAAFDLHSCENITMLPGQVVAVNTGIAFELQKGCFVQICSRSGLALKNNIFVLNAPGIVDEDFRGEIKVILCNASNKNFSIKVGDRIAQGILLEYRGANFSIKEELSESERGSNGFGSTDIKT